MKTFKLLQPLLFCWLLTATDDNSLNTTTLPSFCCKHNGKTKHCNEENSKALNHPPKTNSEKTVPLFFIPGHHKMNWDCYNLPPQFSYPLDYTHLNIRLLIWFISVATLACLLRQHLVKYYTANKIGRWKNKSIILQKTIDELYYYTWIIFRFLYNCFFFTTSSKDDPNQEYFGYIIVHVFAFCARNIALAYIWAGHQQYAGCPGKRNHLRICSYYTFL